MPLKRSRKIASLLLVLIILIGASAYYFLYLNEKPLEEDTTEVETSGRKDEYFVTNPSSGSKTFVKIMSAGENSPALFLIPGGTGSSRDFLNKKKSAQTLVDAGYTVILFDPEGRGSSDGVEDYNGFVTQDGLAEIVEFSKTLPEIDSEKMGMVSFSYGVTMATGFLSRYPDSGIDFLIDWEGPIDRNDTGGCDADETGHIKEYADCDDEEFWAEREAINFIGELEIPYLRLQSEKDHVQPDILSAVRIVNAANEGKSPWVQLNDYAINKVFDESNPPAMFEEKFDREIMEKIADYAETLGT